MFLIVAMASRASSLSLAMLVLIVSAAMFALASVRCCVVLCVLHIVIYIFGVHNMMI